MTASRFWKWGRTIVVGSLSTFFQVLRQVVLEQQLPRISGFSFLPLCFWIAGEAATVHS